MSAFGACILDAEGLRLTADEKRLFAETRPFGFILFARNIDTPDQVRTLCAELREAAGHDAPILVDQEGGRVQRLRGPVWRDWPAAMDHVSQAGDQAERVMYLRSRIMAAELRAIGIDSNCAPLADVARPETHQFLIDRCYGYQAGRVAAIARAVADGLLDGGVLPVLKHLPGHGRAVADSHFDLPVVDTPLSELIGTDFAAFRALNTLPMGMTAHIVFADLCTLPATTSPRTMQIIRDEIGFGGLIMTDDIAMKALRGGLEANTVAALEAGCDVVLLCNASLKDRRIVANAAGQMSVAAQTRADVALALRRDPQEVDIHALEAELAALTHG